jgi:ABC-2 type transport system permease protein
MKLSPPMKKFITCIKREYWEYKGSMIWLPTGLAALFLLLILIATIIGKVSFSFDYQNDTISNFTNTSLNEYTQVSEGLKKHPGIDVDIDIDVDGINIITEPASPLDSDPEVELRIEFNDGDFTVVSSGDAAALSLKKSRETLIGGLTIIHIIFVMIAWTAGMFYLMNSLCADRRDSSVLFWKSLPVSELQNVLTKLLVGALLYPLIAVVAAWIIQIAYIVAALIFVSQSSAQPWSLIAPHLHFFNITLGGIASVIVSSLNALPLLAWLLLTSALTKRSPFLFALLPLIAVILVEDWVWNSDHSLDWLARHLPFNYYSYDSFQHMLNGDSNLLANTSLLDLTSGIAIAVVLVGAAVWCRNNRFER